jgi:hypothetical protein
VLEELDWTIERAVEHLGAPRATRYLRKFYPWYLARLQLPAGERRAMQEQLQRSDTLTEARAALAHLGERAPVAA